MKLTIINGSIHKNGNTALCIKAFTEGFNRGGGTFSVFHITEVESEKRIRQKISSENKVMVCFPLTLNFIP